MPLYKDYVSVSEHGNQSLQALQNAERSNKKAQQIAENNRQLWENVIPMLP